MTQVALIIDNIVHVISILNDRVNKPSRTKPFALLTAWIIAEELHNIILFEIAGLEPENPFYISAY